MDVSIQVADKAVSTEDFTCDDQTAITVSSNAPPLLRNGFIDVSRLETVLATLLDNKFTAISTLDSKNPIAVHNKKIRRLLSSSTPSCSSRNKDDDDEKNKRGRHHHHHHHHHHFRRKRHHSHDDDDDDMEGGGGTSGCEEYEMSPCGDRRYTRRSSRLHQHNRISSSRSPYALRRFRDAGGGMAVTSLDTETSGDDVVVAGADCVALRLAPCSCHHHLQNHRHEYAQQQSMSVSDDTQCCCQESMSEGSQMKIHYDDDYVSVNMEGFSDGMYALDTVDNMSPQLLRRSKHRHRRKKRKRKRHHHHHHHHHVTVDELPPKTIQQQHSDDDDLPQRARWTIVATACLLLIMCLLLVGVTLRMAPVIDEMVRKENEELMHTLNRDPNYKYTQENMSDAQHHDKNKAS